MRAKLIPALNSALSPGSRSQPDGYSRLHLSPGLRLGLLWFLILGGTHSACAQFNYNVDRGVAVITAYTGPGGTVNVPPMLAGVPVVGIADFAFYSCSNVTSITVSSGITNIGFESFYLCSGLTNVSLPISVTSIGNWAFQNCTNLQQINVDPTSAAFSSVAGVLFDKPVARLLAFPGGRSGAYSIPPTVKEIAVGAFGGCSRLGAIEIPGSVVSIADSSFYNCTALRIISVPAGVENIGNSAFYGCTALTGASIGNAVTNIGDYAFASCGALAKVDLGIGVVRIGYGCFSSSGLAKLAIPDSVKVVGDGAFEYCTNLTVASTGNGVARLADFLFDGCTSLTSVAIGSETTSIGIDTFGRCTRLPTIMIPASVTNIGEASFAGCSALGPVYALGAAPEVSHSAFAGDPSAVVYYLREASGWGASFGGVPAQPWIAQVQVEGPSFGLRSNRFNFDVTGPTGKMFVVEACTNLGSYKWFAVQTNFLNGVVSTFSELRSSNYLLRLYRLRSP